MEEGTTFKIFGILPGELMMRAATLAVACLVAAIVCHLTTKLIRRLLEQSNVPSVSLFVNLTRGLVWMVALLSVIEPVFGVRPTAFIAALGVTSLAISLGMQDTISNVVGGLGLMAGKVVQPGDVIEVSGFRGTVVDVNWRATTVRDRAGNDQVIPNSVLNKTALQRLTPAASCTAQATLVVRPDADLDAVSDQIVEAARTFAADLLVEDSVPVVRFAGSDAYGITCTVFLQVADGTPFAVATDALMRAVSGSPWLASAL